MLHLLEHQVLLPVPTVLSRLVSGVRKAENARLHQVVAQRIPHPVRGRRSTAESCSNPPRHHCLAS
ncbi:hypothetical protein KGD83_15655 [Nocardiopsis akebiae]|uniref:Uncharacterized protein n=1 Tax=Nocardiopsis akebiae TaxID=2831968 RepID=A0ABX8BXK3_9ACTN|nr:hypothetical protein [Nocardiopsis akebiae]QUX26816.1 hypothetical protein KGD83_15655 [Nocardiopsis akebiae]